MKKFFSSSMFFCLISVLVMSQPEIGARAQLEGVNETSTTPAKAVTPAKNAAPAVDELLALLPESDGIATMNLGRVFNELLPRLAELGIIGAEKPSTELQKFAGKTGIDLSKAANAVLGLNLIGTQANVVIIIQGLDVDSKKAEAAMKAYRADYKTIDHNGKQIFVVNSKIKSPSAGPVSIKTDETAVVALGQQKMAFGDLSAVKKVVDIHSGAARGGVTPFMANALNETRNSALIRYALNLPENLRQEAMNQGDLFKSIAAIKVIQGTFDVAADFTLSFDAIMRTASQSEAAELKSGLDGLISLVKSFLGGNDQKMALYDQLLGQVKIDSKLSDVSLSINVPRSLMEQLTRKTARVEKK